SMRPSIIGFTPVSVGSGKLRRHRPRSQCRRIELLTRRTRARTLPPSTDPPTPDAAAAPHLQGGVMRSIPAASLILALVTMPVVAQQDVPPEAERDSAWYTVSGERHGISYFPRVRHDGVEYEAGAALTFDRFHTVDVVNEWLRRWAERYPEIMELYEIGRSFEGRPIMQVTLTNKSTGAATTKPAAFFEGGRHSGEITSSESVLCLLQHLLENYGRDERITRLIDTKAIHLRVQNNPDGSNLYLHTAQMNRSSVRPHDS